MSGAVATFGFTFYIQPMLMPMIAEMPRGQVGIKILSWSVRFVVLGETPRSPGWASLLRRVVSCA